VTRLRLAVRLPPCPGHRGPAIGCGSLGGAGGALAPELHQLSDPPAFVALARSSLALYRRLDQEWDGALALRWRPALLLPDSPPSSLRPWAEVELLDTDRIAELEPDLAPVPAALLAPDQAQVHPLRLAAVLARRAGGVATGVAMTDLVVAGGHVVRVRTTAGDLHPGAVVLATGLAPEPWVRLPQRLVKGHLIATAPGRFRLRCGVHARWRVWAAARRRTAGRRHPRRGRPVATGPPRGGRVDPTPAG
jgi:glycine/D-amino acid oxidase-like deaminating enzyme